MSIQTVDKVTVDSLKSRFVNKGLLKFFTIDRFFAFGRVQRNIYLINFMDVGGKMK